MKILNAIRSWWQRTGNLLFNGGQFFGNWQISRERFADTIFYSIASLLTDLCNDVTLVNNGTDTMLFAGFRIFFENNGGYILNKLFENGYVVIGHTGTDFWLLNPNEYTQQTTADGDAVIVPYSKDIDVYVMRSQTYRLRLISDKQACKPFLDMLDSVFNASTTITKRLGAFIVGTPATPSSSPTVVKFSKEQKEELEKEINEKYGAMRNQSQIMILPNGMNFQVVNLAGLEVRLQEKIKSAVLPICDQLKVPANQVALIDANSNKTLSNGTEMREGDFNKYQSFERLLNDTFVNMATYYGVKVDYTIYNKPQRQQIQTTV